MKRGLADWGGNWAAFIVLMIMNGLANSLPLGGQTTGEVSAKYESLFVPAGYVFGIWGLIYLGLLAFLVYQSLPDQRDDTKLAEIRFLFVANCLLNAVWLLLWHNDQIAASMAVMLLILGTLVGIYRVLGIGDQQVRGAERWFCHLPFSIYTGWITVATIANFSALQSANGWLGQGLSEPTWTMLKIALAAAIGANVLFRRGDIAYILVISWAAAGIAVKQSGTPAVAGAASVVAMLAGLLAAWHLFRRRGMYRPA